MAMGSHSIKRRLLVEEEVRPDLASLFLPELRGQALFQRLRHSGEEGDANCRSPPGVCVCLSGTENKQNQKIIH